MSSWLPSVAMTLSPVQTPASAAIPSLSLASSHHRVRKGSQQVRADGL